MIKALHIFTSVDYLAALKNQTQIMNVSLRFPLVISILSFLFVAINPLPLFAQSPFPTLMAETANNSYGIQLSWPEIVDVDHIEIQRSSNGVSAWETWAELPGNQFVDSQVACSHTYYYRARTVDAADVAGLWSDVASATVAPCAPIVVSVYPVPGWYILDVTWIDIASGETSVRLERSFDGATWSELAELPPNTRYYADRFSTAQCSTSLFYRLRMERDGIFSPYTAIQSNAVSPCAPTASWLELVNSGERVRLHWRDNASDETGFEVWRRSDTNPASQLVATLSAAEAVGAAVGWEDDAPDCQVRNYYQLRAIRGANSASPWEPRTPDQLMVYVPNCPEQEFNPEVLSLDPAKTLIKPSPTDARLEPSSPSIFIK